MVRLKRVLSKYSAIEELKVQHRGTKRLLQLVQMFVYKKRLDRLQNALADIGRIRKLKSMVQRYVTS